MCTCCNIVSEVAIVFFWACLFNTPDGIYWYVSPLPFLRSYRLKFERLFNHLLSCLESDSGTFEDGEEEDSDMSYQVDFHIRVL